jgi:hypothetical protein
LGALTEGNRYRSAEGLRPGTQLAFLTDGFIEAQSSDALIDENGAPLPTLGGDCHITRLDKKANSVSADMVCSGAIVGKATMQSSWSADHATGSVHFVGTAPKPTERTSNSR